MKHLFIFTVLFLSIYACKNEATPNATGSGAENMAAPVVPAVTAFDAQEAEKVLADGNEALANSRNILDKAAGLSKEKYAREIENIGSKISSINDRGFEASESLKKGLEQLKQGTKLSADEMAKLTASVQMLKTVVESHSYISKRIDEMK